MNKFFFNLIDILATVIAFCVSYALMYAYYMAMVVALVIVFLAANIFVQAISLVVLIALLLNLPAAFRQLNKLANGIYNGCRVWLYRCLSFFEPA